MSNTTAPAAASSIQSKSKSLKRGLKIEKGFYINLGNICALIIYPESFQFQMSDQNTINVYLKDSESSKYTSESIVEVNEFKRIGRELSEYMGV